MQWLSESRKPALGCKASNGRCIAALAAGTGGGQGVSPCRDWSAFGLCGGRQSL